MRQPLVHRFRTHKNTYVYDTNTNYIVEVSPVVYECVAMDQPPTKKQLEPVLRRYTSEAVSEAIESIKRARKELGLFRHKRPWVLRYPLDFQDVVQNLKAHLSYLILGLTTDCNMHCGYCPTQTLRLRTNRKPQYMTQEIVHRAIDLFMESSTAHPEVRIGLYGGEPLLSFALVKNMVHYVERKFPGRVTNWDLTTNGTLLTSDIVRFLVSKNFTLRVSLDGPPGVHDRYRRFRAGSGTFAVIERNLQYIRTHFPNYYASQVMIQSTLAPPIDYLQIEEFVRHSELILTSNFSAEHADLSSLPIDRRPRGEDFGFACIINEYARSVVHGDCQHAPDSKRFELARSLLEPLLVKVYYRKVHRSLSSEYHPGGCCIPGQVRLYVSSNGKLYPCEKESVRREDLCIGDVWKGIDYHKAYELITRYTELTSSDCKNCWALRLCGICFASATDLEGLSPDAKRDACEAHKQYLDWALRFMCILLEVNPRVLEGLVTYTT